MKSKLFAFALAATLVSAARAEFTVTLSHVHLCCKSCIKGVDKATATVAGAAAQSDGDAETVTITAPDKATAQKAVDAIVAAGYFGVPSDPAIKVEAPSGAKDGFTESLDVTGVHLCCTSCVDAVNDALAKVPGVKANTARKNAAAFEVSGNFDPKAVFTALHEAGLSGKAGK
jgi:copper chaperone CopZ